MIAIKSQHQAFLDFIRTVLRCDPSREASLAEGCMLLSVFSWVHYETAQNHGSFPLETIKRSAFRLEATRSEALSSEERQQLEEFARQISQDQDVLDLFCQLSPWAIGNVRQIYDWCCGSQDQLANRFAGLVPLLRCYDACCRIDGFNGNFSEIPQEHRAKLEQVWRRFELKEEDLKSCWDCLVRITLNPIRVKVPAEIQRCIAAYQEQRLPRRLLLCDYAKVVLRDKEWQSPYNPWQAVPGQEGQLVEGGLTSHESAFHFAAMNLAKYNPTSVIAALFYSSKRNDMPLEQWVLWNFLGHAYNQQYMPLIINPSPHTLAIWHDKRFAGHFAVRDETLKWLYEHQFPNSRFVTFAELADLFRKFSYKDVLLLARDMGEEELRQVLEQLSTMHPREVGRMELMLPCSYLDAEQKKGYLKIITRNASLRRILLLPSAVSRVAPRKKALLYLNFPGPGEPEDVVGLQEAVSIKNGRLMWVIPRHCDVTLRELLAGKTTLKELARQKKKPPEARIQLRHRAEEFAFSQEIVLRYIFLENHHGKAAARAYYCASTHGQPGRKTKGKCLSDRIEKGLRGENRQEVLARLALLPLNNPGLGDIIVRDIRSAYREELEELTLKTMWFCCRKDLQLRSSYDDEVARTLFCGPEPMLASLRPGEALERDYLAAMAGVLGEPQIRHWQQLDLILDEAQQAGYLRRNRVHEMMSSLSRQLSQEAQNVRSNLAKKTFSWQEEERILAYFQEKTSVYVKKHRASRYEAEPLVLAAAIRFFTGMSAAEVCALRWSDLDRIRFPEEELYQLRVERYAREDGSVCSHAARDDWRRYRLIPVVPELVQMMEGRRLFLARQRDEDPEQLSGRYMFPRRGRPGDQPAPCRPKDIRNQCSKVLSQVNIAPLKLDLPEEKGRVEIDLNRYYGDQFRANFRLRASDTCGLTGGELAYLLGQAAQDTFSEHYCDFGNGMVQLKMLHKLQRWTTPLVEEFHAPARHREGWLKQRPVTERAKPTKAGAAELELRLEGGPDYSGGQIRIEVKHSTGFEGDIMFTGEEG